MCLARIKSTVPLQVATRELANARRDFRVLGWDQAKKEEGLGLYQLKTALPPKG